MSQSNNGMKMKNRGADVKHGAVKTYSKEELKAYNAKLLVESTKNDEQPEV